MQWELKKYLLEFNSPVGRHTGELIGLDLLATMKKFQVEKKVCLIKIIIAGDFSSLVD
jgi:hypothetical protein